MSLCHAKGVSTTPTIVMKAANVDKSVFVSIGLKEFKIGIVFGVINRAIHFLYRVNKFRM